MDDKFSTALGSCSTQLTRPDGSSYLALLSDAEERLSNTLGLSRRQVQICALQRGVVPERYCRNNTTLSCAEQIRLLNSHVAVIGQGGLGGTVTEILSRIGVGRLTLVDGDVFEESNLNRQVLATSDTLGVHKAEAGKKRVKIVNPAVEVTPFTEYLVEKNSERILNGCDIAVDCLDSIDSRFTLVEGCRVKGIPMVTAAIGGCTGQASVVFPGDTTLQNIYGPPQGRPQKGAEKELGTLPHAAMLMAAIECSEIITILCSGSSNLRNKLLLASIQDHTYETVRFS